MSVGSWLQNNIIGGGVDYSKATEAADKLLAGYDQYASQEQKAYSQEQGLADQLKDTIAGRGPSLARAGMGQAIGDLGRQYSSMSSGARGAAVPLARFGAMEGFGDAASKVNQSGIIAQVLEKQQAQQRLGAILAAMAAQGGGMYGTTLGGGLNALGLEQQGRMANSAANQQAFAAAVKAFTDAAGVFGGGTASGMGQSGGGGGDSGMVSGLLGSEGNGGGDSLAKYGSLLAAA